MVLFCRMELINHCLITKYHGEIKPYQMKLKLTPVEIRMDKYHFVNNCSEDTGSYFPRLFISSKFAKK